MTTKINSKEPKLYYLEYVYDTEGPKVRNIIAAYSLPQADQIYAMEILAKDDVEERDTTRFVISDERALEMGLTGYTSPGLIN